MRTDNLINVVYGNALNAVGLYSLLRKKLCVLDTVAVNDKYFLLREVFANLAHTLYNFVYSVCATAGLAVGDKLSFVADVKKGLEVKNRSHNRRSARNASAAFKEEKIVDREEVNKAKLVFLKPLIGFVDSRTVLLFLDGIFKKKSLTHACAKGIDKKHFSVGIGVL